MTIKEQIRLQAKAGGMNLCGFASVDRLKEAPEKMDPNRVLPGCKTVIVIGVRLLDGIVQANFRSFEDGQTDLKGLYGTYGYSTLPNFQIAKASYDIAQLVEQSTGEIAVPCSSGPMTNGRQVSFRHCAVAAGLGEFGWMGIVLTPEFGPRNRFGVILTTAEIEPDPLYDGPKLCNPEKCGICVKVCPSCAISESGAEENKVSIGEKQYTYAKVNPQRCFLVEERLRKKYGAPEEYCNSDTPTQEEYALARQRAKREDFGLQSIPSWYCGRCLSYCPAGKWGEKFKSRGLSKGYKADLLLQAETQSNKD